MTLADNSTQDLVERGQALVRSLATRIVRNVPVPVDLEDLPTTYFTPTTAQSGLALLLIGLGFAVTVGISRLGTGQR